MVFFYVFIPLALLAFVVKMVQGQSAQREQNKKEQEQIRALKRQYEYEQKQNEKFEQEKQSMKERLKAIGIEDMEEWPKKMALAEKAAQVDGKHYTEYVETVKQLKRENRLDEAEKLLRRLIAATKAEAKIMKWQIAPWYEEQLGIVQRKKERLAKKQSSNTKGRNER